MSFFHIDTTQAVEILQVKQTYLFYIFNIMGTIVLVKQGARASAIMILIMLNLINSVPAR